MLETLPNGPLDSNQLVDQFSSSAAGVASRSPEQKNNLVNVAQRYGDRSLRSGMKIVVNRLKFATAGAIVRLSHENYPQFSGRLPGRPRFFMPKAVGPDWRQPTGAQETKNL